MIFVDASALIAIIADEADADELADCLERAERRLCSALSLWETVAGLCRSYRLSIPAARTHVAQFVDIAEFLVVAIGPTEFETAMDAYTRYGKGRHHAALNMGDCFAYACARTHNAALLFKGDDFSRTDIARVMR